MKLILNNVIVFCLIDSSIIYIYIYIYIYINTDEFYNSLNIIYKFKDIYKCKTILIMYDVLNSKSTSPYKSIFFLKKNNYSQRSRYKFIIPSYRLQIKYFSIFYNGPILWNNLEISFKTYLSKSVLKRNLKKRYINHYL